MTEILKIPCELKTREALKCRLKYRHKSYVRADELMVRVPKVAREKIFLARGIN
jgi:hypothetical protein